MVRLTLLSRTYCHLCHEMELALAPLLEEVGAEVEVIDVDGDSLLERDYGEFVPVLLHDKVELCRFVLDARKVSDYLEDFG